MWPLREPLPTFAVPLEANSNDVALDLQLLVNQCYANGRYDQMDFRRELVPPLPPDDAEWADQLLREKGLR